MARKKYRINYATIAKIMNDKPEQIAGVRRASDNYRSWLGQVAVPKYLYWTTSNHTQSAKWNWIVMGRASITSSCPDG